jgi:hypothetical protein
MRLECGPLNLVRINEELPEWKILCLCLPWRRMGDGFMDPCFWPRH